MDMQAEGHDDQEMMQHNHQKTPWVHYAYIMLGPWLIMGPFAFGYLDAHEPDANQLRL
jgi:hypothetical protein